MASPPCNASGPAERPRRPERGASRRTVHRDAQHAREESVDNSCQEPGADQPGQFIALDLDRRTRISHPDRVYDEDRRHHRSRERRTKAKSITWRGCGCTTGGRTLRADRIRATSRGSVQLDSFATGFAPPSRRSASRAHPFPIGFNMVREGMSSISFTSTGILAASGVAATLIAMRRRGWRGPEFESPARARSETIGPQGSTKSAVAPRRDDNQPAGNHRLGSIRSKCGS